MDAETRDLLQHLHRGGKFGYLWTRPSLRSHWYCTEDEPPTLVGGEDVYWGVHPTNERGGPTERSRIATIAAINCLFAEFDFDSFANEEACWSIVNGLDPFPSDRIASGAGVQCYWRLTEPQVI